MNEKASSPKPERIRIENVNHPGKSTSVVAGMYNAMRDAMLAVLPVAMPGLTQSQLRSAVVAHLPEDLYPGGARSAWWAKAVQLDLEAKGEIVRELSLPLRWHRLEEAHRPSEVRTSRDGGSRPLRHGGDQTP